MLYHHSHHRHQQGLEGLPRKIYAKHNLPGLLLSDPELQAIQSYGVWQEKQLYEKVSIGVARSSFLIDEQGVIEKASFKVKPILTQRSCWVSKKCVSVVISGDERTSPDMHQESLHAGK